MLASATARQFCPPQLDCAAWEQLQPLYRELQQRPLHDIRGLQQWLKDWGELSSVIDEYGTRCYIEHACHTDDPDVELAYLHFVEQIEPKVTPLDFELKRRFVNSPLNHELSGPRFEVLLRGWHADIELFRPKNIPLQTELTKLNSEYDKLIGAMLVDYKGELHTLQQLARFQEEPDRAVRQETWEHSAQRRLNDQDQIDGLFDRMFDLRVQIAQNAGKKNFRDWAWQAKNRFDYTPQQCIEFADAIEQVCIPRVAALDERRRQHLGVDQLRPWDESVDPLGRPPLRPFDADDVSGLLQGCTTILHRIGAELGERFATLKYRHNLDLDSRKGKRAGGFQASLEESGEPFIFMNAAGVHRDVETLLHEAGHAFHFVRSLPEPLVFLRRAPLEFCEVASMTLELLSVDKLDVFYPDPDQLARAQRNLYEGIIRFFPWMAVIDGYQHWLYTHPQHTRIQRHRAWIGLLSRFQSSVVDWSGYEAARTSLWHRQGHLFHAPFYYVEYGIAQLGALQLWQKYRNNPQAALADFHQALALGGTRPLPQLFDAAGIQFDFTLSTLEPLIAILQDEIDQLPD